MALAITVRAPGARRKVRNYRNLADAGQISRARMSQLIVWQIWHLTFKKNCCFCQKQSLAPIVSWRRACDKSPDPSIGSGRGSSFGPSENKCFNPANGLIAASGRGKAGCLAADPRQYLDTLFGSEKEATGSAIGVPHAVHSITEAAKPH